MNDLLIKWFLLKTCDYTLIKVTYTINKVELLRLVQTSSIPNLKNLTPIHLKSSGWKLLHNKYCKILGKRCCD